MNIFEFTCTETFVPVSKGMPKAERRHMTERINEIVKYCSEMEKVKDMDYLEISKRLYEMPSFSKKEIHCFSNTLKIRKIKKFLLMEIPVGKAVSYTDFINEVNKKLNIYGDDVKKTMPIGVTQTALNEMEKKGHIVKLIRHRRTYIQRIK